MKRGEIKICKYCDQKYVGGSRTQEWKHRSACKNQEVPKKRGRKKEYDNDKHRWRVLAAERRKNNRKQPVEMVDVAVQTEGPLWNPRDPKADDVKLHCMNTNYEGHPTLHRMRPRVK